MPIPSGYDLCPPWAKDAAGGSTETSDKGLSVVVGNKWVYVPWPKLINSNAVATCCGKRWRFKLSFLELNGHMARVCGFPEDCLNSIVCTNIDNRGSCRQNSKGYDIHCSTTDTLIRAVWEVATSLNCRAYVKNVRRLSSLPAIGADALSKADFKTFWRVIPDHELEPVKLPKAYLKWLENPVRDTELGARIVSELRSNGNKILY